MPRIVTTRRRKRAKSPRVERQRRTEFGGLLDAMMREALDDAMRGATGEPQSRPRKPAMPRRKIEIYGAGCPVCHKAEATIRRIAGADHDVEVLYMHQARVARQAARLDFRSVPRVVVDGPLVVCSTVSGGVDEAALRSAIAA